MSAVFMPRSCLDLNQCSTRSLADMDTPDDIARTRPLAPDTPLRIGVVLGSTRPSRRSPAIADWILAAPFDGVAFERLDLVDVGLPLLREPVAAAFGRYEEPETKAWSRTIDVLDAVVLVTPEYNASTSAALKNALDHLYAEWHDKPVAFVGYGMAGGVRAVEHLRTITAELGMAGLPRALHVDMSKVVDGVFQASEADEDARSLMLAGLRRWAIAFRGLRRSGRPD
ncbi:MAG: NAD(P)H-dependent oxidoreductase [Microbacterium enclense]